MGFIRLPVKIPVLWMKLFDNFLPGTLAFDDFFDSHSENLGVGRSTGNNLLAHVIPFAVAEMRHFLTGIEESLVLP